MGYLENMLPKYLARLGVDVHVVSTDLPPYYWIKEHQETYGSFCSKMVPGSVESIDGYTLHVLAHSKVGGYVRMAGLGKMLRSLRPDIVQTMAVIGWTALEAAIHQTYLRYKLFTACHTTASVFPLASQNLKWWNIQRLRCTAMRSMPGYLVSLLSDKCYGATCDCADVAVRFFGVPRDKIIVSPLGVDTEVFHSCRSDKNLESRRALREQLGFLSSDIVCIYTGRFTDDKNPLLLAKAVQSMAAQGLPYRGLFIGNGPQAAAISSCTGCVTLPFVPVSALGEYFRAVEIGVWPTQESTSMLDAAGCGLPIIVNDTIRATERVDGNGLKYRLNDLEDLVRALTELQDASTRKRLGELGSNKISEQFAWSTLAARRLADYKSALASNGKQVTEAVRILPG